MKKLIIYSTMLTVLSFGLISAHIDNNLVPEDCGSCHVGHGLQMEPMLNHSEEMLCYQCHSDDARKSKMIAEGKLSESAVLKNVEEAFEKRYRHPVVEGTGHSPTEKLPGTLTASVDHAECVDCHNPHQKIVQTPSKNYDVQGFSLSGQYVNRSKEYEVCLKCHSTTIMAGESKKDMRSEFSLSVKSQHPVTNKNYSSKSKSLKMSLNDADMMNCSDCHTNNDANGAKGPHGSDYEFLLSGNYDTDIYANESIFAYEFCYSCHDRFSILSNESFSLHEEHIKGDPIRNIPGTSCYTCHASHSSSNYPFLIDFNPKAVTPETTTRRIYYQSNGYGSGECYLNCHGHNHSPGKYTK